MRIARERVIYTIKQHSFTVREALFSSTKTTGEMHSNEYVEVTRWICKRTYSNTRETQSIEELVKYS